jgi:O-antigen/teichoic acid export membrane protein
VLTILLEPSTLGIFFVVSAFINLFVYFSDIGLAAALIQKKEEPTKLDLATTFSIQQAIMLALVLTGLLFSAKIASFYNLDSDGLLLIRVLIFSLILSSLKTIPSILLERKLNFTLLVIPQIAENIVFYSTAVILAYLDFGITAFTWAVLARGVVGLVLIYILSPYIPSIGFNRIVAKKLTSFGIPFQLNSILALIKDDLLTVVLGKLLLFSEVGYIGWAQKFAFYPLRFFMDSVNKVTFPTYSRLQGHSKELGAAIEKSLFFVTYLVYPSVFGIVAIAPKIIDLIPKYQKWEPALPLLFLFSANAIFSAISTTFTIALFAIGKPKIVLIFMVFWTGATWGLTIPLVLRLGYIGVGVSSALVAASSILTVYFVKKQIPISVSKNILGPLFISILMYFSIRLLQTVMQNNVPSLILTIIVGAIIYFTVSFILFKKQLVDDAMTIIKSLLFKK